LNQQFELLILWLNVNYDTLKPCLIRGINLWNEMVISIFDMGQFLRIVIPIGITIPLRRWIHILLKNEKNSYSNENRLNFSKKSNTFFIFFQFFFSKKKKKETPTPLYYGWPPVGQPHMAPGVVALLSKRLVVDPEEFPRRQFVGGRPPTH
jgi:hypothetical protein